MADLKHVTRLRDLRRRARDLEISVVDDLKPFFKKDGTFSILPEPPDPDISVSTTCTIIMVLARTGHLDTFYGDRTKVLELFRTVVSADWRTAGLPADNAFTSTIVIRSSGFLKNAVNLSDAELATFLHDKKGLLDIAIQLSKKAPAGLSIKKYPPAPAIGYWLVDGMDRVGDLLQQREFVEMARWASSEFYSQLASVEAGHHAMMDPTAMIMAGCLVARLRSISVKKDWSPLIAEYLPSDVELFHSICALFQNQTTSGMWHKYFPLFHFDDAGADYCFSFEFLEALLNEFGSPDLFRIETAITGFELAVTWCERNRLRYHSEGKDFCGWNSGGAILTLRSRRPESWATAAIHLFLHKLDDVLSDAIQADVLVRYHTSRAEKQLNAGPWNEILESEVQLGDEDPTTVKKIIDEQILEPVTGFGRNYLRHNKLTGRRSVLLFGPPGTSKTRLVKAAAKKLGWPCVEVNPSHFLDKGRELIYVRANEIFDDLLDLSAVVVLFDEMDPLVMTREEGPLEVENQFLTTTMLPKLAELYDHAQVVSFMNTNHIETTDPAISRSGRFDTLLCVGPPTWNEKLNQIRTLWDFAAGEDPVLVQKKLRRWIPAGDKYAGILDRFSFHETRSLFEHCIRKFSCKTLEEALDRISEKQFKATVESWGRNMINLWSKGRSKSKSLAQYVKAQAASRLQ